MRSRKRYTAMALAGVMLLVIALHALGWLGVPERWLRGLVTPGSRTIYSLTTQIGDQERSFASVEELEAAYREMRQAYIDAQVDQVALRLLRQENDELRQQLSYVTSSVVRHIGADVTADVVGKNIEPLGTTLVINRGTDSGVAVGNPAIVGKGVLVGKVVRVEEDMAIVRLLTDNQSKIAATIVNNDRSIGVVEGGYDVSVRMNFIPQNERVAVGDVVITSGLEHSIPQGLLIGTIDAVQRETYQAFQQAIITPFVAFDNIRIVSLITGVP